MNNNPIREVTFTQNLATGALSFSFSPGGHEESLSDVIIKGIYVNFSAALSNETGTITFNSQNGANYDTSLEATAFSTSTGWTYENDILLNRLDAVDVAITNANTPAVVAYGTVKYQEVR